MRKLILLCAVILTACAWQTRTQTISNQTGVSTTNLQWSKFILRDEYEKDVESAAFNPNGEWLLAWARADTTDDVILAEMTKRHIAGASVAVIRNGKVVVAKGYGSANIEQAVLATPKTMYQIASTTKPFTAMAIMMLVENGRISLDEKAAKYLPKSPAQYSAVTVRQLLTHTSGVNRDLRTGNVDDFTADEFWKRLATAPVSFKPGERWEYSNTGYILLGIIIESVTKKSYGEFLNERVFKPLGMKDTKYLEPPGRDKNRAIGYDWQENTFRPSPYFSGGFSAGGLISTVSDMAKWDAVLNTEKLLKRSSLEQIWMPAKLSNGKLVSFDFRGEQSSYGFGWFLTSYRGHKVVTHGGTVSGFSSQIMRFTDDKITVIVNSNSKSGADRIGHAEFLAKSIADIHVPNLAPVVSVGVRTPDAVEEQIIALNRRMADAFKRNDMLGVARSYADAATIFSYRGKKIRGREVIDRYWTSTRAVRNGIWMSS